MSNIRRSLLFAIAMVLFGCGGLQVTFDKIVTNSTTKLVLVSEVEWEQLNPARGDKSPQAGTLWGDRKGSLATGFLVKFVDGFSSPPPYS